MDPTQFSLLGIQVVRTDIFYNYTQGETLILVLAGVPGGLGQLAVDLALDNANQAVDLASGFVDFEVQHMEVKSAYQDIGDNSNGGSATMATEGVIYPMETWRIPKWQRYGRSYSGISRRRTTER